jgi:hypothetical protein
MKSNCFSNFSDLPLVPYDPLNLNALVKIITGLIAKTVSRGDGHDRRDNGTCKNNELPLSIGKKDGTKGTEIRVDVLCSGFEDLLSKIAMDEGMGLLRSLFGCFQPESSPKFCNKRIKRYLRLLYS